MTISALRLRRSRAAASSRRSSRSSALPPGARSGTPARPRHRRDRGRRRDREQQHRPVDDDLAEARDDAGRPALDHPHRSRANEQRRGPRPRQVITSDSATMLGATARGCAERAPHRKLALPRHRAPDQDRRDIRACDEQYDDGRAPLNATSTGLTDPDEAVFAPLDAIRRLRAAAHRFRGELRAALASHPRSPGRASRPASAARPVGSAARPRIDRTRSPARPPPASTLGLLAGNANAAGITPSRSGPVAHGDLRAEQVRRRRLQLPREPLADDDPARFAGAHARPARGGVPSVAKNWSSTSATREARLAGDIDSEALRT